MNDSTHDRQDRLQQVIAQYLEAIDVGAAIDRDELLRSHPDLAEDLQEFFATHDQLQHVAAPRGEDPGPTLDFATGQGGQAVGGEVDKRLQKAAKPLSFSQTASPEADGRDAVRYFGDYELLEEIARGGMGVVYKARQVNLDRIVAVKMILAGRLASEEDVRRFYQEAEAAANLEHSAIVPIYEVGQHEGQHFFSMAFVDGPSLASVLADGPLPPHESAQVLQQVAEAIAYAHSRGVIHRDLKPANVLLPAGDWRPEAGESRQPVSSDLSRPVSRLQPKITDFGLAKRVAGDSSLTATGQILGTPSYMPPEQAAGRVDEVRETADVYSLGAVLYALLTGHPPFQADNPMDTLMQVLEHEPVSPRLVNPAVPRDLETICLKCLQKWPDERYATAAAVAEDVGRFLNDEPILARPVGAAERLARWLRKRRRSVALTAAACAATVLVAAAAVFGWQAYQRSQLGHVNFRTNEPLATAEVFGADGEVLQKFAIPNEQPHPFPEGNYRVRLSAPGLLSETAQMWVRRGGEHEFQIDLTGRHLWEPIRLGPSDRFEIADLDGGRSDVILTQEHFGEVTLRRLDGRTTATVWSLPLDADEPPEGLTGEADREFWRELVQQWNQDDRADHEPRGVTVDMPVAQQGSPFAPPDLLQPCPDLNGDGTGDLVWMLRHQPALLAMSGRDAHVLWRHHSEHPQPGRPNSNRVAARVAEKPLLWDVDADGRSDVVVMFHHPWGALWVEAICGASGTSLWKYQVDAESIGPLGERAFELLDVGGTKIVALAVGRRLIGLDASTGQPAWPPRDLGPPVRSKVRFADFNGDGSHDVLVPDLVGHVTRREGGRTYRTDSGADTSSVRVVSLPSFETLWSTGERLRESEALSWPLVGDLDNDGRPEVAFSLRSSVGGQRRSIDVLDGRTGESRWSRRVYGEMVAMAHLLAGPDFDADGHNELILVSTALLHDETESYVFVDALSGRDGRTIAWWKHAIMPMRASSDFYSIGEPSWWQASADGWPQLVVPWSTTYSSSLKQPTQGCALVALGQSATAHLLHDVSKPRAADFNGDAIADLYYTHQARGGTLLTVAAGRPPESWRRLGRWTPGPDCDADGLPDLVKERPSGGSLLTSYPALDAVSSRDGRAVRSFRFPRSPLLSNLSFHAPALPQGDLDGDGTADLLVWSWLPDPNEVVDRDLPFPLAAYSSRTGRQLWSAEDWRLPDDPKYLTQPTAHGWSVPDERNVMPFAVWCQDLDTDGAAELLCLCYLGGGQRGRRVVVCLSGRNGRLIWKRWLDDRHPGTSGYNAELQTVRMTFADLNADQTQDVVLTLASGAAPNPECQIRALHGRDGQPLWPAYTLEMRPGDASRELPEPVVGDLDGDAMPEIVFPDSQSAVEYHAQGSQRPMHFKVVALDGASGKPKWQWKEQAESFRPRSAVAGNPVLADLDGDGRQAVCLGIQSGDQGEIIVLNEQGEVRHRFAGPMELFAHDVDGDGRDELLFSRGRKIKATRGDGSALWERPTPDGQDGTIREIHGGVPTAVVAAGRDVYGLDGRTGRSIWRGPSTGGDTAVLWPGENDHHLQPRLVTSGRETFSPLALRTDGAGSYLAAPGTPVSTPPPPDPRLLHPLPWSTTDPVSDATEMLLFLTAFLLLAAPLAALGWLIWRRRWTLRVFLAIPVAVVLWLGLLQLFLSLPGAPKPGLRITEQVALEMLNMAFFGGTLLIFPALLVYCLYRRRWRLAVGLVGLSLMVSGLYGWLTLSRRSRWLDPLERFTWEGWHTILYLGAWLAGLLVAISLLGWLLIRAAMRFVRWYRAKRPTAA